MAGEEPPRFVVYVPLAQGDTHHALIELEAAGVVMQPRASGHENLPVTWPEKRQAEAPQVL